MIQDLQRANMLKRISAWLLDAILLCVIATFMAWLLSMALNYDSYVQQFDARCSYYEEEYGVDLDFSQEDIDAMSPDQLENLNAASTAFAKDTEALYAYNMMIYLIIIMISLSVLLGYITLEFAVPMLFKNGQTIGKKVFGLGVMRKDGIRVNGVCMFVRTVLGKFSIETMIPAIILLLLYIGALGIDGLLIIAAIVITEIVLLYTTRERCMIHDKLAQTVTVDFASQLIFDTPEAQIAYKKKLAAQKAAQQSY